jgi:hypothetical protein
LDKRAAGAEVVLQTVDGKVAFEVVAFADLGFLNAWEDAVEAYLTETVLAAALG